MGCGVEIHVGDIGTVYRVHVLDDDHEFDISAATTSELIFQMPNGVIFHKSASITSEGSPPDAWFLEYEVQPGDGIGSPGEFHDNEGPLAVQAFLEWADGKRWHSNIQTMDTDGQELRIFPNLD
jgi:hypothetical protein